MREARPSNFSDVLTTINEESSKAWVYLPKDKRWSLQSESAVLVSDEIPPELEGETDAGIPEFAKRNNLRQAVSVNTLQDIVANAKGQRSDASLEDLFKAFEYYYEHDAFIDLG